MLKMLDRYVVKSYVFAYLVVFVSLVMLVVLFDFFLSIDEFFRDLGKKDNDGNPIGPQTVWEVSGTIVNYYLIHSTHYFALLSGFLAVIAAGFVLARMSYTNELTAVLASGVSLHRVFLPIAVCGFLLNLLLVADQEFVMPALRDRLVLERSDQAGTKAFTVEAFRDEYNSLVIGFHFVPDPPAIFGLLLVQREIPPRNAPEGTTGRAVAIIRADHALFEPADAEGLRGRWKLTNGFRIERDSAEGGNVDLDALWRQADAALLSGGTPVAYYPLPAAGGGEGPTTDMTPKRLRRHQHSRQLDYLSYSELAAVAEQPQISDAMRAELQVIKHMRITQPLTNMLLLLAAVPFFLTRERKNLILSSALAILMVGGGLGVSFMAAQWSFEQSEPFWYLAGAWAPIAIYAPLAVLSVEGIKT